MRVTSSRCLTVALLCAGAVMVGPPLPARPQADTVATGSSTPPVSSPPTLELAPPALAELDTSPFPSLLEEQIRQNEALAAGHQPLVDGHGYIDFGLFFPQGSGPAYAHGVGQ